MTVEVLRGGSSSPTFSGRGKFNGMAGTNSKLTMRIEIPVTRGISDVHIKFSDTEFTKIARTMMKADREAAIKAFGAALSGETTTS